MKARDKDNFREIKNSLPRFISILIIIFLGVFVLIGLISTGKVMRNTIDDKIKKLNQEDIKISVPIGLEDKDREIIEGEDDISELEYGYDKDVFLEGDSIVIKVLNMPYEISKPEIVEGRNIKNPDEIVLDSRMKREGKKIGDIISFQEDNDDDKDNDLKRLSYKIVGFANSLDFLEDKKGTYSERGYGKISYFAYIDDGNFSGEPTLAKLKFLGTEGLMTSDKDYVEYMDKKTREIKIDLKNRPKERFISIQNEISGKINDAEDKISDTEEKLTDAKDKLVKGREDLNKGKEDYKEGLDKYNKEKTDAESEISKNRNKLYKASVEINDGERKLIDGYEKLSEGKKKLNDAKSELNSGQKELVEGKEKYQKGLGEAEASEKALKQGEDQLIEGRKKLDDGWQKIEESKAKLSEGIKKYEDGEKEYDSGKLQLDAGKAKLVKEMGASSYEDAVEKIYAIDKILDSTEEILSKLPTIEDEIASTKEQINQVDAGISKIDDEIANINLKLQDPNLSEDEKAKLSAEFAGLNAQKSRLQKNKDDLSKKLEFLNNSKKEIDNALEEINKKVPGGISGNLNDLKAKVKEGKAGIQQIDENEKKLVSARATLDASKKQIEEGKEQLEEGIAEAEKGEEEFAKNKEEIEKNKKKLQDAKLELAKAKNKLDESEEKLNKGNADYESGKRELDEKESEYLEGREKLSRAKEKYLSGTDELKRGEEKLDKELKSGKNKLDDAKGKLYKAEKDLKKGESEYNDKSKEAEGKISDARGKIADGRKYLSLIKQPRYRITPRHLSGDINTYIDYAKRVDGLSFIFPIFFFAIALLVCFTTMTRMVDENRVVIGTYKALGYANREIGRKFFLYGSLASIIGGTLGAISGSYILTYIIGNAYSTKTIFENHLIINVFPLRIIFAIAIGFLFTTVAAIITVNKNLEEKTAYLLRSKAPSKGNRILIERIPFIWNNLSFLSKVTARNLFLSKKRMFMTVVGVMGCAALLVLGFGLSESVKNVEKLQFKDILKYDISVLYDSKFDEESYKNYRKSIEDKNLAYTKTYEELFTMDYDEIDQNVNVIVPSDNEKFKDYISLRDKDSGEELDLSKRGAIITEKLSKLKKIKVGDPLKLRDVYGNEFEVEVSGITEFYIGHNVYMNKDYFEKVTGSEFVPNTDLIKLPKNFDKDKFTKTTIENKSVFNIADVDDMKDILNQFLYSITKVEIIILIVTTILEVVVLYNLTNINIEERIREVSTIKVLGFYPKETTAYIYKETYILAIIGILIGLVVGKILHYSVLQIVVPLMSMLPEKLTAKSFILAGIITVSVNTVIMIIFHFRIKKINAIDALKSNE
ncbi:FtsX-like permease family protein [Peptoniphilus sp. SGI.035]|uniref:FtsX-like permease family protein n=1 Tax=Peptoniphilus sp. SGI.035 TaxID=3420564 RepID=UPI003D00E3A9